MELTYYPGCSLHGTSEEYNHSILAVCRSLGLELRELEDWTCCGASSAHALNDELATRLALRNLVLAGQTDREMLVACAACYSRLKFADKAISEDPKAWLEDELPPMVRIVHIHDLLARPELIETIRKKIAKPLGGLRAVPYYGCLTVRPPKVMNATRPENPTALDEVLETLGAEVMQWSYKTDCCGGSFSMSKPEVVRKLSGDIMDAAVHAGGECLVTDCPMCQANLDTRQGEIEQERGKTYDMPIFFITELLALALGEADVEKWLSRHIVDPRPLLKRKGLL